MFGTAKEKHDGYKQMPTRAGHRVTDGWPRSNYRDKSEHDCYGALGQAGERRRGFVERKAKYAPQNTFEMVPGQQMKASARQRNRKEPRRSSIGSKTKGGGLSRDAGVNGTKLEVEPAE